MGWYGDHVLPRILDHAMDTASIREARARVTAGLFGQVIEIGFGTGHNVAYAPPKVTQMIGVEPSQLSLHRAAGRVASAGVLVDLVAADARRLPLPDSCVDAALCTWSLCTIPEPVAAIRELRRVLRPGGQLHFVEHGRAPDATVRRWQTRLNPLQRRLVGGCTLDRDIPALLDLGGMVITRLTTYYAAGGPKALGWTYEGAAAAA